ncbi:diguanylate cyclase [Enterobacteriaceae bacterium H16N7]|nr:diguanylate cyclase [Dryocola clanedunensis]
MRKRSSANVFTMMMGMMLIPFIVLAGLTFFYTHSMIRESFLTTVQRFDDNTSIGCIEIPIREIRRSLNSLTQNGFRTKASVDNYIADKNPLMSSLIKNAMMSSPYFIAIIISSTEDKFKSYPDIPFDSFLASEQSWYPKAVAKDNILFSTTMVTVNDKANQRTNPVLIATKNLLDENAKTIGNITVGINGDESSDILKSKITPFSGEYIVADSSGHVIMSSNKSAVFSRTVEAEWLKRAQNLTGHFIDRQSGDMIFYHTYNNPDWVGFTIIPAHAYDELFTARYKILILICMVCFILYIIGIFLCRSYLINFINLVYMKANGLDAGPQNSSFEMLSDTVSTKHQQLTNAKKIASVDPLTLAGTRRKFSEDITEFMKQGKLFQLAIIDVDNFKKINDSWGHATGDIVLQYVVKAGENILGQKNQIYRYGGEEFVILFPGEKHEYSLKLMELWLEDVGNRTWRESELHVTFSGGLVSWKGEKSAEQLIEAADKLMYTAKESGKNKILSEP